jgi:hypothetical protein
MAANINHHDDTPPDFDHIIIHGNNLVLELSRLRNLQGVRATQAILAAIASLGQRMTRGDNRHIRAHNSQRLTANSFARLLPLLDVNTGLEIPNCPETIEQIVLLPGPEAIRILEALQVNVPVGLAAQRAAVQAEFTFTQ